MQWSSVGTDNATRIVVGLGRLVSRVMRIGAVVAIGTLMAAAVWIKP